MSGELDVNGHGWNVNSLKEHFEKLLTEKDKAISIALAAAKEAVGVAEDNSEKWRANANEWRGAMSDREKTFVTRNEFEIYKASVEKALGVEKQRADIDQGKGIGLATFWGYVVGVVGIIIALISLALRFMPK